MDWKFHTDAPIYAQLMEQIKIAIVTGKYAAGDRLPSVRDMAAEAGVNPNTLQRAFAELERQGLVYSQRTLGRLVTEDAAIINDAKRQLARRHIFAFREAMEALGFEKDEIIDLLRQEEGDI